MSTNFAIRPAIVNVKPACENEPGFIREPGSVIKPGSAKIRVIRISAVRESPAEVERELAERVERLNELAKKHPFSILHKVKKHDPL
jgi:hypothetical protein